MNSEQTVASRLETAGLKRNRSIVIGSGILGALGIRTPRDLDVVIDAESFAGLALMPHYRVQATPRGLCCQAQDDVEIWDRWTDPTTREPRFYDDLLPDSVIIDGVRFMSLDYVRQWKKSRGREKDKRDLALIDAYRERTHG